MDLNLVVLCGRLAAPAEHRRFDSGATHLRLLITVRTELPNPRLDLIPVLVWDPPDHLLGSLLPGSRVWVSGMVQRRFWEPDAADQRRSGLEVVAIDVSTRHLEEPAAL